MSQQTFGIVDGVGVQGDVGKAHQGRDVIRSLAKDAPKRLLRHPAPAMAQGIKGGCNGAAMGVARGRASERIPPGNHVAPLHEGIAQQLPGLAVLGMRSAASLQALDGLFEPTGLPICPRKVQRRLDKSGRLRDRTFEVFHRGLGVSLRQAHRAQQPQRVHL